MLASPNQGPEEQVAVRSREDVRGASGKARVAAELLEAAGNR